MEAPLDKALTYFNVAHSYQAAADELLQTRHHRQAYYNDSVIRVNYALSVELYLKSFLIEKGTAPGDLAKRSSGHNLENLLTTCQKSGLWVDNDIAARIRRLNELETLKRDRYLDWDRATITKVEPLGELPEALRAEIGPVIAERGGYILDEKGLSLRQEGDQ
jgi:HEPN domain-containing protein